MSSKNPYGSPPRDPGPFNLRARAIEKWEKRYPAPTVELHAVGKDGDCACPAVRR